MIGLNIEHGFSSRIIARYTDFSANISTEADMLYYDDAGNAAEEPNSFETNITNITNINNIINENPMISLQTNLRFLNNIATGAVENITNIYTKRGMMMERPAVLNIDKGAVIIDKVETEKLTQLLKAERAQKKPMTAAQVIAETKMILSSPPEIFHPDMGPEKESVGITPRRSPQGKRDGLEQVKEILRVEREQIIREKTLERQQSAMELVLKDEHEEVEKLSTKTAPEEISILEHEIKTVLSENIEKIKQKETVREISSETKILHREAKEIRVEAEAQELRPTQKPVPARMILPDEKANERTDTHEHEEKAETEKAKPTSVLKPGAQVYAEGNVSEERLNIEFREREMLSPANIVLPTQSPLSTEIDERGTLEHEPPPEHTLPVIPKAAAVLKRDNKKKNTSSFNQVQEEEAEEIPKQPPERRTDRRKQEAEILLRSEEQVHEPSSGWKPEQKEPAVQAEPRRNVAPAEMTLPEQSEQRTVTKKEAAEAEERPSGAANFDDFIQKGKRFINREPEPIVTLDLIDSRYEQKSIEMPTKKLAPPSIEYAERKKPKPQAEPERKIEQYHAGEMQTGAPRPTLRLKPAKDTVRMTPVSLEHRYEPPQAALQHGRQISQMQEEAAKSASVRPPDQRKVRQTLPPPLVEYVAAEQMHKPEIFPAMNMIYKGAPNTEQVLAAMGIPTTHNEAKKRVTNETKETTVAPRTAINAPGTQKPEVHELDKKMVLEAIDMQKLTDKVYKAIEARLRSEKIRRGLM